MNKLLISLMAFVFCLGLNAQHPDAAKAGTHGGGARREFNPELYRKKMKEFITCEAKLTEAEATKFFPMLNEMLDKQQQVMKQQRELMMKDRNGTALTEDDYERMVTKMTNNDVELKKIEQSYFKKFYSALSWKKIYEVRQALSRFQMEALRHFQPGKNRNARNVPPAGGNHR